VAVQLAKHLVETDGFGLDDFRFDDDGGLVKLDAPAAVIEQAVACGIPFMTNGWPGEKGEPGCARPYGSYRPTEPFRDYPFLPSPDDLTEIREQLALGVLFGS